MSKLNIIYLISFILLNIDSVVCPVTHLVDRLTSLGLSDSNSASPTNIQNSGESAGSPTSAPPITGISSQDVVQRSAISSSTG